MNKIILSLILLVLNVFASEFPIEKAKIRSFGDSIQVNAKVIELQTLNSKKLYATAYIPVEYAQKIKVGQGAVIHTDTNTIKSALSKILPALDLQTQRIVALLDISSYKDLFFINQYLPITLYLDKKDKYVSVKKSALSFYNNEWVVFVPVIDDEHKDHDGHEGHDEHEEENQVYDPRVIQIMAETDEFVGIYGLEENEEYVSDKSYYIKSMLLKSSLDEHGH